MNTKLAATTHTHAVNLAWPQLSIPVVCFLCHFLERFYYYLLCSLVLNGTYKVERDSLLDHGDLVVQKFVGEIEPLLLRL